MSSWERSRDLRGTHNEEVVVVTEEKVTEVFRDFLSTRKGKDKGKEEGDRSKTGLKVKKEVRTIALVS